MDAKKINLTLSGIEVYHIERGVITLNAAELEFSCGHRVKEGCWQPRQNSEQNGRPSKSHATSERNAESTGET